MATTKKAAKATPLTKPARVPKHAYEQELLRLQAELVKLQEWVRAEKRRLVVIFEGRDAAGKGGSIKRVTEYLNARVARDRRPARPRPSGSAPSGTSSATSTTCRRRARSCCSTAPGTTGPASSGSWGSAPTRSTTASCTSARRSSGCSSRTASAAQVLVLGQRRGAGGPFPLPARRPDAVLEAVADGPQVDHPLGGLLAGQGRDDAPHQHPRGSVVHGRERRQAGGAAEHDRPPALDRSTTTTWDARS